MCVCVRSHQHLFSCSIVFQLAYFFLTSFVSFRHNLLKNRISNSQHVLLSNILSCSLSNTLFESMEAQSLFILKLLMLTLSMRFLRVYRESLTLSYYISIMGGNVFFYWSIVNKTSYVLGFRAHVCVSLCATGERECVSVSVCDKLYRLKLYQARKHTVINGVDDVYFIVFYYFGEHN